MKNKGVKEIIIVLVAALIIFVGVSFFSYKKYVNTSDEEGILNNVGRYDASKEIDKALKSLNSNKKAEIITNVETTEDKIALSFEGIGNTITMDKVLRLLKRYDVKADFFITGIEAGEDSREVKKIVSSGHEIGNLTLSGETTMENLSPKDLVSDFCRANKILKVVTGKDPVLLKCNSTNYTEDLLSAAYASGNKYVMQSNHYISYQSFKNAEEAYGYINNLSNGTIISIKMDGVLNKFEYEASKKDEKPAIDKDAALEDSSSGSEEVTIVNIVEWMLEAIKKQEKSVALISTLPKLGNNAENIDNDGIITGEDRLPNEVENKEIDNNLGIDSEDEKTLVSINFKELIEKNNGEKVKEIAEFYTTQNALAYTFRGLANEEVLDNTLSMLNSINAKGTFFLTKADIKEHPDKIKKIVNAGHEIANGGITCNSKLLDKSTEDICKEIYVVDELLKKHGIKSRAYMPGYGYVNDQVKEAMSSIKGISGFENYELFTYTKSPIKSKYKNMNPKEIVSDYFSINTYVSLKRGEIVYFRLDTNLFEDNNTIPIMIELITKNYVENGYVHKYNKNLNDYELTQKSLGYSVVKLSDLQNTFETGGKLGRYEISEDRSSILKRRTLEEATPMLITNYVGNVDIGLGDFTENEQGKMDRSGTINTEDEDTIFFTFDDWGGDPIVNELLDVLEKHKVKVTFFAIARNADINGGLSNSNPNLLRRIALDDHDIGSHTYYHETLDLNKGELDKSLTKSYDSMWRVIGDLNSLKPYFRPPTLLIRREGLLSVFENGFNYSISGNISTHDYQGTSAEEIIKDIISQLEPGKGNIVVMHMNNQSYYTPEALDIFLTNNENGVYGKKYKIAKLSDYLGN